MRRVNNIYVITILNNKSIHACYICTRHDLHWSETNYSVTTVSVRYLQYVTVICSHPQCSSDKLTLIIICFDHSLHNCAALLPDGDTCIEYQSPSLFRSRTAYYTSDSQVNLNRNELCQFVLSN